MQSFHLWMQHSLPSSFSWGPCQQKNTSPLKLIAGVAWRANLTIKSKHSPVMKRTAWFQPIWNVIWPKNAREHGSLKHLELSWDWKWCGTIPQISCGFGWQYSWSQIIRFNYLFLHWPCSQATWTIDTLKSWWVLGTSWNPPRYMAKLTLQHTKEQVCLLRGGNYFDSNLWLHIAVSNCILLTLGALG